MVNWWLSWVSILTSETERRSWACACEREHICVYGSDNGRKHAGTPPRAGSPWPPHRRALSRCHRRPASKLTNQIFVGWPGKKSTWTWGRRRVDPRAMDERGWIDQKIEDRKLRGILQQYTRGWGGEEGGGSVSSPRRMGKSYSYYYY